MDAATVALLVIVGVIVAAIAFHLIAIAVSLRKITTTLTSLRGGVQAIKGQTDPIGDVVAGVAGDVAAIDDDLEGLLVLVGEAQAAQDARPVSPPPRPASSVRRAAPVEPQNGAEGVDEAAIAARPTMREAVARARAGSIA